jgi:hypothetical protein
MRSPSFRAKNFSTCTRSPTARGSSHASLYVMGRCCLLVSELDRHLEIGPVSQLDTWPVVSPVNASRRPSRDAVHHLGSGRLAIPYPMGDFHLLFFASKTGALGLGSTTALTALKRDFRSVSESRHSRCSLACLKRARCRLRTCRGSLPANAAVMRAEALSRKPGCAGALAFSRTGDPATVRCGIRRSAYRPMSPAPVKCISTRSMGRAMPGCWSQNVAC